MIHRNSSAHQACRDFEADLVLYYYGDLTENDRSRVQDHLKFCSACGRFFEGLGKFLPLTVKPDDPPEEFWQDYTWEIKQKLAAVEAKIPWWQGVFLSYRSWSVPALATALVLILALTLTFRKRIWTPTDLPPDEEALLEVLPMAENLEFFKAMDLLDSLDLLEAGAGPGNGSA